jgi:hypothetical protein
MDKLFIAAVLALSLVGSASAREDVEFPDKSFLFTKVGVVVSGTLAGDWIIPKLKNNRCASLAAQACTKIKTFAQNKSH